MFLTDEELAFSKIKLLTKPVLEQQYFCIGCTLGKLKVIDSIFMDDAVDRSRLANFNMFKSHSDATIVLNEINNIFKKLEDC